MKSKRRIKREIKINVPRTIPIIPPVFIFFFVVVGFNEGSS